MQLTTFKSIYLYLSSYSKPSLTLNHRLEVNYFLQPHLSNVWIRTKIKVHPTNQFNRRKLTKLIVLGEVKNLYTRKNNLSYSYSNVTTKLTVGPTPLTLLTLLQVYELGWSIHHLKLVQWTNMLNQILLYSVLKPYLGKFFLGLTNSTHINNKTTIKNLLINI